MMHVPFNKKKNQAMQQASHGRRPILSVVIPFYNEAAGIHTLFSRLGGVLNDTGVRYEIICIDDGSRDQTRDLLAQWHRRDARIKILALSRNFGKEIALTAGLTAARGRAVVPMDADLQDPPELIHTFLAKWREGYQVVYGSRRSRGADSWLKRTTAHAFYHCFNRLSVIKLPPDAGDFRLMDRQVVDAILQLPERTRFMKGIYAWTGFRQCAVAYDRPLRAAGKTKFNYRRLWHLAMDAFVSFSPLPLKLASVCGFGCAVLAMAYAVYLILRTFLRGIDVPGYASLMVVTLFLGGLILMTLGLMGEYIGRIYTETQRRPLFIIEKQIGFSPEALQNNKR